MENNKIVKKSNKKDIKNKKENIDNNNKVFLIIFLKKLFQNNRMK